jgi:hypothetical protein
VRELADAGRVRDLLRALGQRAEDEVRIYLIGGASAVLEGWRRETIDADILIVPDSDRLLREIPALKESLRINVEIVAPSHFIPELPGWQDRSPFIGRWGRLSVHHYDFYAQALAKIERGEEKDLKDVQEMVNRGLVRPAEAWRLFRRIEPSLYRYPAVDPRSFARAVEAALGPESLTPPGGAESS